MQNNGNGKFVDSRLREPFVRRVKVRNFKSIGTCDVALGTLTILVGRNGSGKSNFLDASAFVTDSLQTSLDHAIKVRGGVESVRRRSTGHPHNFAVSLEVNLGDQVGFYGFEITTKERGAIVVKRERLKLIYADGEPAASYEVENGEVKSASEKPMPPASADRLYLVNAAGLPQFRRLYDGLASMGFYSLNPEAMKELQSPDAGELLQRDGSNISSVVSRLAIEDPAAIERISDYMSRIVDGITGFDRVAMGPRETLEFRQTVRGAKHPWKFFAANMSDGTLRALGALIAVFQVAGRRAAVPLVGIEEPETALHPRASGALMDCLREAAARKQILVTTHSTDLLDQFSPESDRLIAVVADAGESLLGPVSQAEMNVIRDHLYPAGEMLRMDQLQPDPADVVRQSQMRIFDDAEEIP